MYKCVQKYTFYNKKFKHVNLISYSVLLISSNRGIPLFKIVLPLKSEVIFLLSEERGHLCVKILSYEKQKK